MSTFPVGPFFETHQRPTLMESIRRAGLTSSLVVALDAGDSKSYSSGQTWLDTSGSGTNYFLGTTSGAEATDPTFNGTAGQRSANEYWSSSGDDVFTYNTTNTTWMQDLHKNAALFTIAAWVRPATTATSWAMFGTGGSNSANTGINFFLSSAGNLRFVALRNTAGTFALNETTAGPTYTANEWQFVALSLNENGGAGASFYQRNATTGTFNGAYDTPTTGNASFTSQVFGSGNTTIMPMTNGSRAGMFAMWSGAALNTTQLTNLYNLTRRRYGV